LDPVKLSVEDRKERSGFKQGNPSEMRLCRFSLSENFTGRKNFQFILFIRISNVATSKSGKKSVKQSEAKRVFNTRRIRAMKSTTKQLGSFLSNKDKKGAETLLPEAYKAIDKAAKRGILKKNTAARRKSKLARDIANAK